MPLHSDCRRDFTSADRHRDTATHIHSSMHRPTCMHAYIHNSHFFSSRARSECIMDAAASQGLAAAQAASAQPQPPPPPPPPHTHTHTRHTDTHIHTHTRARKYTHTRHMDTHMCTHTDCIGCCCFWRPGCCSSRRRSKAASPYKGTEAKA
jgi:hypothetical protein